MKAARIAVQILIVVTISIAELPAQRYSDEDWLRLRKGLKTTPGDNTFIRPKPDPPGPGPATTSPGTIPDSMQLRVLRYACALGAPQSLVLQIAEQESHFAPARGPAGEIGIMQVKPETAQLHGLDASRLSDIDYGIYACIVVLLDILREFQEEETVLGVYNGGRGYASGALNGEARAKVARYIEEVRGRKGKYEGYSCRNLSGIS